MPSSQAQTAIILLSNRRSISLKMSISYISCKMQDDDIPLVAGVSPMQKYPFRIVQLLVKMSNVLAVRGWYSSRNETILFSLLVLPSHTAVSMVNRYELRIWFSTLAQTHSCDAKSRLAKAANNFSRREYPTAYLWVMVTRICWVAVRAIMLSERAYGSMHRLNHQGLCITFCFSPI